MNGLKTKIRRETKRHVAKHRKCIVISVSCTTDTKDYFYNVNLDTEPYIKHSWKLAHCDSSALMFSPQPRKQPSNKIFTLLPNFDEHKIHMKKKN